MPAFDPYLVWLDIPTHERPVNHYRLLGLRPLENDPNVISTAAERVIAHVSRFQQSEHSAACQSLLDELNAARNCLLDPMRKSAYDSGLGQGSPSSGERQIGTAPQVPGRSVGERQIANSPPVPGVPAPGTHAPATPQVPSTRPAPPSVPQSPIPQSPAPQQSTTSGLPQSVLPPAPLPPTSAPNVPQSVPTMPTQYDAPMSNVAPANPTMPSSVPSSVAPQTAPQQPPDWAAHQATGEVTTVIAGQTTEPQQPTSGRGNRSRKMRRAQQANSAYMLVGIAMAMIVFFFGAVLVLAIYLGG